MDRVSPQLLAVQLLLLLVSTACANTLFFKPGNDLVVCPDNKHSCNSDTTCCLLPNGQYGCCMYPNVESQSPWIEKIPPPMKMEFHNQPESIPWAKKLPGLKVDSLNISTLHIPACSVSQTLCKSDSGLSGCCPFPNAVCCDKGQCCPSGFQCNSKSSKCEKPTEETTKGLVSLLPVHTLFEIRDPVVCPNAVTVCPKDTTCCLSGKDSYACCPYSSATCCSDQQHCCPNGFSCDLNAGRCVKKQVHMILVKMTKWTAGQVCPDMETTCPAGSTCCSLQGGRYGCCPYPKATCCTDKRHCCPNGYTCDLQDSKCVRRGSQIQSIANSIVCPDKITKCPSSATCCPLVDGSYGCCPYVKATCCKDHEHCCPNGFYCDVRASMCVKKGIDATELSNIPLSAIQTSSPVICPDMGACNAGSTCCLSGKKYECCPIPEAVCCHDDKHCCPKNYHCDLEHKRCVMGQTSLPLFKKTLPSKSLIEMKPVKKSLKSVMCPDYSECPDRNTCCLMDTGAWGCCPYLNAVCCIDRKHCCPKTYFCDMKQSKCVSAKSSVNPIFSMIFSKLQPGKK